jgi:hypothetical protein
MVTCRSQVSQKLTICASMTSSTSTYSGIEKTATDAEKYPNVDCQRKAKGQRDVHERLNVHAFASKQIIGDLSGGKGEEQEEKCADKFADGGNEEMTGPIGKPSGARHTLLARSSDIFGVPGRNPWLNHAVLRADERGKRRS